MHHQTLDIPCNVYQDVSPGVGRIRRIKVVGKREVDGGLDAAAIRVSQPEILLWMIWIKWRHK